MNTTSNGSPNRPDVSTEIEEVKDGMPKVREYWELVKREMETLLDNVTSKDVS
jgi:hypothetical protein